jgi:PEP-CTERM motif
MNPESKRTRARLKLFCALACLATSASAQTTIYSTLGPNTGYSVFNPQQVFEAGWSQSSTFSDMSIAAKLDGGGGTVTGTAYLTTRIGPGTTVADEVARYDYTVTSPQFQPELKTLFSGLTLGPDSYYLVISGSGTLAGWETTGSIFPVTAPGVEVVHRRQTSFSPVAPYPPATNFGRETASDFRDTYFQYIVTSIPEPGTMTLCLLGAGAALICRVRKR